MKILDKIIIALGPMAFVSPVFAEDAPAQLTGDNSAFSIGSVLDSIMNLVFPIAGLICVVFIIIGGYMWMTSAGDPSKVKQAQGTLTWAIIGLVFVLVAVAIIDVVMKFVTE